MKNIQKIALATVVACSLSAVASAQAVFKVTKVQPSSPNSLTAISNSGEVVVNTATPTSATVSLWNWQGGLQGLGSSGAMTGVAINDSSEVVGAGDPDGSGVAQAFLSRPVGGTEWLGSLGGKLSAAGAINDAGAVVGLSFTSSYLQHAFLWTQAGGMQDLTPDLTSIGGATATAINSSNEVAGYYFPNGSRVPQGFTWTQAGGLQSFGPTGTLAFAINNAGTVVGQSPNAQGYKHAFSWTASGGMIDLGTLGGTFSTALSINNRGWIVGTALDNTGSGQVRPFLWTPSAGMQDLIFVAGLPKRIQAYSVQVNDYGVIALVTNQGLSVVSPKMDATISSSQNPSKVGQAVTFTSTVNSIAGPPPDGELVQFKVTGQVVGNGVLSNGVAQFTTSTIPAGSHVVTATYVGDANYLPSSFSQLLQVVNQ